MSSSASAELHTTSFRQFPSVSHPGRVAFVGARKHPSVSLEVPPHVRKLSGQESTPKKEERFSPNVCFVENGGDRVG